MIAKSSRYFRGRFQVMDGEKVAVRRRFPRANEATKVITWTASMRLDLLSARTFGAPDQWWRIMDLNPYIQSPADLRPGMKLRVPDV